MDAGPFGPFVLLEPLAQGGMGDVWLARRFGLKGVADIVVVKVTRGDHATQADARQRFRDETRIALLLAHPCIARTIDAGRVDEMEFLALEAVEGINLILLHQRMRARKEPLPDHVALFIAASALDGLAFAHTVRHPLNGAPLGVVHRDISPHNVMVTANGGVKLIDFGVALSTLKEAQTEQGIVIGKMAYMSPEQARGDGVVDARADVFAVAVVLYEMLTGERYYPGMSADAIWRVAGTGQYVAPALGRLDGDVRRVLERALDPDPARRTASAAAMRAEVAGLLMVRGGITPAAGDLAALVRRHAGEEIARLARARVAAQAALSPTSEATTDSLASAEGLAVEAALRQQPADPVTVRLEAVAGPPPVETQSHRASEPHVAAIPRTVAIPRAQLPPEEPRRAAAVGARGALLLGVGAVVVLAIGVGLGLALGARPKDPPLVDDAGLPTEVQAAAGSVPSLAADAGIAATLDPPAALDAGTAVVADGPALKLSRRERLLRDAQSLQRCNDPCTSAWRPVPHARIAALPEGKLGPLESVIQKCLRKCGR